MRVSSPFDVIVSSNSQSLYEKLREETEFSSPFDRMRAELLIAEWERRNALGLNNVVPLERSTHILRR